MIDDKFKTFIKYMLIFLFMCMFVYYINKLDVHASEFVPPFQKIPNPVFNLEPDTSFLNDYEKMDFAVSSTVGGQTGRSSFRINCNGGDYSGSLSFSTNWYGTNTCDNYLSYLRSPNYIAEFDSDHYYYILIPLYGDSFYELDDGDFSLSSSIYYQQDSSYIDSSIKVPIEALDFRIFNSPKISDGVTFSTSYNLYIKFKGFDWSSLYLNPENVFLTIKDFKINSVSNKIWASGSGSYIYRSKKAISEIQVDSIIDNDNKNQEETNERLDKTNEELGNLNDNLTDNDSSGASDSASNFFSGFESDDHGLTSIITAPLNTIKSLTSQKCSPLGLQVPFLKENNTINLPCMSEIYEKHFGDVMKIYQTVTFGLIAYWVCVKIYAMVKGFQSPDDDKVEVMDL